MNVESSGALSLLAPAVAIMGALWTHRVVPALGAGIVAGALVASGGAPVAAMQSVAEHLRSAVFDFDHARITMFSIGVAIAVGLMGAYGGTADLVRSVERVARGPRGTMVASWLAGALVFFDDYANCMVVGATMGPLCDRHRVSRAKLAYIVDSTAAPVASIALVSTWIGYEVGLVSDALPADLGQTLASALPQGGDVGFAVFLGALPYRFYSLFTLVFVGAIAASGRDFGPMLAEERRCRAEPVPTPAHDLPRGGAWRGVLPVATLIAVTLGTLIWTGATALGDRLATARPFEVLGSGDSYGAMLTGSAAAVFVASVLGFATAKWTPRAWGRHVIGGARPVLDALLVLYCAWMLASVVQDTGAALYLQGLVGPLLPVWSLPTVVFLVAAVIAFATGTSFGTMSILIPLAVPLALQLAPQAPHILFASTGAVLAGACFGDHASPISDTTVLSAAGSRVDLVTHVNTQLPYALSTALIAVLTGYLPAGLGVSPAIALPVGAIACVLWVMALGTRVDQRP